jgi:citrate lyase subunit alpha/citrate CoA-transferase
MISLNKNILGVEVPESIAGLGQLKPFDGKRFSGTPDEQPEIKSPDERMSKIVDELETAIRLCGLRDGMTISFHHHFRNGDYIQNLVLEVIARMGIKRLTIASSSLSDIHAPMIEHIKNGVIYRIETSGLRGELANQISHGLMEVPVLFRSHGGRAYAIASGELKIDVAFLGVPSADLFGNANGFSRDGDNSTACGSLGYAMVDAQYADKVVLLTNNIVPYPNTPCAIPQTDVDYIVKVDAIGDPKGIMSGATRYSTNPKELKIAKAATDVMEASGYFVDGFSFQTGTGGSSLAVTRFLREKMIAKGIKANFALGGITAQIVKLHEEGLVKKMLDVQSFDLDAVASVQRNEFHKVVDAHFYAGPGVEGAAVDQLDMVVLSALEIDVNFNVNVLTGSDGVIRGAVGGHPDTSAGAKLAIIVAPLVRGRIPSILDRVNTICTPGMTVDVLVTDQGIAVNPARQDLMERLSAAGIKTETIEVLKAKAEKIVGHPKAIEYGEKIVGVVSYRDSSVIDLIREVSR